MPPGPGLRGEWNATAACAIVGPAAQVRVGNVPSSALSVGGLGSMAGLR
jgi:hypothetical protein